MNKTLLLLLLTFQLSYAQGVNNSTTLNLTDGVTVTVRGNYTHEANAAVNLEAGTVLNIEGSMTDNGGSFSGEGEVYLNGDAYLSINDALLIPTHFTLHSNHPNPFNPITTLRYDLPEDNFVLLTVYDMLGREIVQLVNTTQEAGFKSVQWDATDSMGRPVSADVYRYQIQAGDFVQTKKMVLLK